MPNVKTIDCGAFAKSKLKAVVAPHDVKIDSTAFDEVIDVDIIRIYK